MGGANEKTIHIHIYRHFRVANQPIMCIFSSVGGSRSTGSDLRQTQGQDTNQPLGSGGIDSVHEPHDAHPILPVIGKLVSGSLPAPVTTAVKWIT